MTTTIQTGEFSAKTPDEILTLAFDFAALLGTDTLNTVSCTVTTYDGTDASPSAILSGVAAISSTKVLQRVTAGQAGVTYLLAATANTVGGSRYVLYATLPVRLPS